jgi:hypothetical protein
MKWNNHSKLSGAHAFLGASKYSWLNYDEDKLVQTYSNFLATQLGTRLHALASELIQLGIKLPKQKKTLNMFVNDAIGFKMTSEQTLFYSINCFGTADAISFRGNLLRIHDLKTGTTKASMSQLLIYAALFCLEYDIRPGDIEIELRIYQNNDVDILNPTADMILPIMDKIVQFDKLLNKLKEEE